MTPGPGGAGRPDLPDGAKCHRLGTHRILSPAETVARVTPLMALMGITRVADVTGLDRIGVPVVMVCRPNARSLAVSQGKGCDLAVRLPGGRAYFVGGTGIDQHGDAHARDGFCNAIRRARVRGEVTADNQFRVSYFQLVPTPIAAPGPKP